MYQELAKLHSTISKIALQFRYLYLYIALFVVLGVLTYSSTVYLVAFVPVLLYFMRYQKKLILFGGVVLGLYFLSFTIQTSWFESVPTSNEIIIYDNIDSGTYQKFVGKVGNQYVIAYTDYEGELHIGDTFTYTGTWERIQEPLIPGSFHYANFMKSKRIYYSGFIKHLELVDNQFLLTKVRASVSAYIEQQTPQSASYIKTFILADKSEFDDEFLENVNQMGVSHLFAVSGLHVGIIVLAIEFLLHKTKLQEKTIKGMVSVVLLGYIILSGFTPSLLRAGLFYMLLTLNKHYGSNFSTLDLLSILFIGLLLYQPYYIYHPGFTLSFLITFVILLAQNQIPKETTKALFYISVIATLFSLPIISSLNNTVNLLTFLFNIVYVPVMSFVILPLALLTFFLPLFDSLSGSIFTMFNQTILWFGSIETFVLPIKLHQPIFIIVYYILLIGLMQTKTMQYRMKYASFLVFFFIFHHYQSFFNPVSSIHFIGVYGDATLIQDSFNQCNILVDTGEVDPYHGLSTYLQYRHITHLDYVVITHFHSDHYGAFEEVSDTLPIKQLITNQTATNQYITCGNLSLHLYPPDHFVDNENNNSIVLTLEMGGKTTLFTGDIEEERELELLYRIEEDIDYLKVSHHGSNTSSSSQFIDYISPKEVFIIVHPDNSFNHPSDSVIESYLARQIPIYRTDQMGTIDLYYFYAKEWKKTSKTE